LVIRLLPLIAKLELWAPLAAVHPPCVVESDNEPEKAGEDGDIVTSTVPTAVPEGEPPIKELFDRETDEIDCETGPEGAINSSTQSAVPSE
jgi:hypothetical protein